MTDQIKHKIQEFYDKTVEIMADKTPSAIVLSELFLQVNTDIDYEPISLKRYFQQAKKGILFNHDLEDIKQRILENMSVAQKAFQPTPTPYIPTPLPKETVSNYYQLRELWDKKLFKVLIFSDCHGFLADLKALRCINKVLQHNNFDEVCINGDIVDLPYLSRHPKKLYEEGILKGYSEIEEIRYTREQILLPLRMSTDAKIRIRVGNHDDRAINPNVLSESQLARLLVVHNHYKCFEFDKLLNLNPADGYIYDPSTVYTYFDKFDVVHGLSLAKNASEKNIQEYMSSGTSGHSHRLNSKFITNRKAPYVWFESGHTRIDKEVEYFPTGKIPDWQQGFITVYFLREDNEVRFFAQPTNIIEGRCMFNGVVYDGN